MSDVAYAKQRLRERVWERLEREGEVIGGKARDRIPNFRGAEEAADRLAAHSAWQAARVVKSNPDKAQLPVRVLALRQGRLLFMAVPKLATREPFYRLDPAKLTVPFDQAAGSYSAADHAQRVGLHDMTPIDLIMCGSVAVNHEGQRIGKGAGYSDIEIGLLSDAGLIHADTVIATTVHPLQVLDQPIPVTDHDFHVDLIITPDQTITCPRDSRTHTIHRNHLTPEKIAAIPSLTTHR
jgi:5-formyltetrahydrofolate cyclo-ligase